MNPTSEETSRWSTAHERRAVIPQLNWVRDDRHATPIALMVWMLIVIMIVPGGFNYEAVLAHVANAYQSDPFTRVLWLLLLGGGLLAIAWRMALAILLIRSLNVYLMLFVVLVALSVLWSIAPRMSIVRTVRMVTFMVVSAAFVLIAWEPQRFQNVLKPIITLMLAGSLVFGLVDPRLAIHQFPVELIGDWHGLTTHKNTLGALAGIGLIFWVHAWLAGEGRRLIILISIAIAGACLLLSHSSTALMGTVFSVLFMLMLLRSPRGMAPYVPYLVGLFGAMVLLYSLAILNVVPGLHVLLSPIIAITGKDPTFTGRTDIWAIIAQHIKLHPILGTGYGAYWTGPVPSSPSYVFIEQMHFYPGSAHNGYMEIINDLGFVGLMCLIGYLVIYVQQCLRLLVIQRNQMTLYLTLFFQQALTNLSESHWLDVLSMNSVIMALATFCIARSVLDLRLQQRYGPPGTTAPMMPFKKITTGSDDDNPTDAQVAT